MKATILRHEVCDDCDGTGRVPVYSWPRECEAECATSLRNYWSGGQYYLCDRRHPGAFPAILWRPDERERALVAFALSFDAKVAA